MNISLQVSTNFSLSKFELQATKTESCVDSVTSTVTPILKRHISDAENRRPTKKKNVQMHQHVQHRQTFGKQQSERIYATHYVDQSFALVDESMDTFALSKAQISLRHARYVLKSDAEDIRVWKKLPYLQRPIGKKPVGTHDDEMLTEKVLSKRAEGSITKRNHSDSWWQQESATVEKLYQAVIATNATVATCEELINKMTEAAAKDITSEVITFEDLKDLYCDACLKEIHPDISRKAYRKIINRLTDTQLIAGLEKELHGISEIKKNSNKSYTITYHKISAFEIRTFVQEFIASH